MAVDLDEAPLVSVIPDQADAVDTNTNESFVDVVPEVGGAHTRLLGREVRDRRDSNFRGGWVGEGEATICGMPRTRFLFILFVACSILAVAGLSGYVFYRKTVLDNAAVALIVAIYCVTVATVMTGFQIHLHLTSYTNPPEQRKIIRVLLMVPVYAITSLLALKFRGNTADYINLTRNCYEAFVLYTFFYLMLDLMGGRDKTAQTLRRSGSQFINHPFPLCCLSPIRVNRWIIQAWECCIFQYVLLKPTCTIIAIICKAFGHYNEEHMFDYTNAYPWLLVAENLSVTIAFSCLFYFYLATKGLMEHHNPTGKFIAIKIVVFLCFWQGMVISLLVKEDVIHSSKNGTWSQSEVATGTQDFLVCIEMMLVSIYHKKVFPHIPYLPATGVRQRAARFRDVCDAVVDVRDVHEHSVGFWSQFGSWVKVKVGLADPPEHSDTATISRATTPQPDTTTEVVQSTPEEVRSTATHQQLGKRQPAEHGP